LCPQTRFVFGVARPRIRSDPAAFFIASIASSADNKGDSLWRGSCKRSHRSGRYKLAPTQQAEAIQMIRLGAKSQAEIAELFNVNRSTISRIMKDARKKSR
jgi:DNA invertase Pin-like site-specific DNA recombinase